jgi:hypothetical protein
MQPYASDTMWGRILAFLGRRSCKCLEENVWSADCGVWFRHGDHRDSHSTLTKWPMITLPPREAYEKGNALR